MERQVDTVCYQNCSSQSERITKVSGKSEAEEWEVSERHIFPSVTDAWPTVSHRYQERYSKSVLHRMTFLLIIHRG